MIVPYYMISWPLEVNKMYIWALGKKSCDCYFLKSLNQQNKLAIVSYGRTPNLILKCLEKIINNDKAWSQIKPHIICNQDTVWFSKKESGKSKHIKHALKESGLKSPSIHYRDDSASVVKATKDTLNQPKSPTMDDMQLKM